MTRRINERRRQSAQRKGEPDAAQANDAPPARNGVESIDALARAGRTAWLSLLFALSFVTVTLLGVEDIDFFAPERQTELPIVGVSIPTLLAFALEPLLCVALYANMHFHLMKLWEAVAKAPARLHNRPVSDALNASFIVDLGLSQRTDRALRPRPLRSLTSLLTILLVFAACPIVLAAFWWRSATAHNEALTVIACGIPMLAAIFIGATSWIRLRRLTHPKRRLGKRRKSWLHTGFALLVIFTSAWGWLRTEGTLDRYARDWSGLSDDEIQTANWSGIWFPVLLAPIDLQTANLVATPDDWLPRHRAKREHRVAWCRDEGMPLALCGKSDLETSEDGALRQRRQQRWCQTNLPTETQDLPVICEQHFTKIAARLAQDWQEARRLSIAALPSRNLSFADLNGANLFGARLEGADFTWARLEGADLSGAQLDKETSFTPATLRGAGVKDVDLSHTSIARLSEAFGDTTVTLPVDYNAGESPLAHWSSERLTFDDFRKAWRAWQAEHHPDLLPPGYKPD